MRGQVANQDEAQVLWLRLARHDRRALHRGKARGKFKLTVLAPGQPKNSIRKSIPIR